jgi:alpha-ketoglutarate-dependent taurine dioxygenase
MRYWITTGHEKTETPLKEELQEAMDHIDSYLNDEANCFKFKLSRGDMLFVNNRFLCHNRTEYEDWKEEDKKRTLVRTWINSPNSN